MAVIWKFMGVSGKSPINERITPVVPTTSSIGDATISSLCICNFDIEIANPVWSYKSYYLSNPLIWYICIVFESHYCKHLFLLIRSWNYAEDEIEIW